jgi:hypothetical protein
VVSYWRDASIIFHNYATGDVLKATPLVGVLLHSCTDWRDIPSLARELEGTDVPAAAAHFPGLRFGRLLAGAGRRQWSFDHA